MKHYRFIRTLTLSYLIVGICFISNAQKEDSNKKVRYSLGIGLLNSFTLEGHVRVREFDLQGDILEWDQLGMHHFYNPEISGVAEIKKKNILEINYQRIYFRGKKAIDGNIAFNGTIIDGRSGIDLSPSNYQRLRLEYRRLAIQKVKVSFCFLGGFIYDYFTVYLDGEISPESERFEVYEAFERQALPYPYLGLIGTYALNDKNNLELVIRGTYIPKFNSFFHEGGDVALHYRLLNADLDYIHKWTKFHLMLGVSHRSMYLLGDSTEDTNEFSLSSLGPNLKIYYKIN